MNYVDRQKIYPFAKKVPFSIKNPITKETNKFNKIASRRGNLTCELTVLTGTSNKFIREVTAANKTAVKNIICAIQPSGILPKNVGILINISGGPQEVSF